MAPVTPPAPVAPPSNLEPPQPLLDAGDWITLTVGIAAAVLALFTLVATRRSASAAELSANAAVDAADASKRSAKTSEDMAEEAQIANQLAADQFALQTQQQTEARAEAAVRAADQARLVRIEVANLGGLQVLAHNDSDGSLRNVRLVSVVGESAEWKWRLNKNVLANRELRVAVLPGRSAKYFVCLVDGSGKEHRSAGDSYTVTCRFTDLNGARWQRVGGSDPVQVPVDDSDLNP